MFDINLTAIVLLVFICIIIPILILRALHVRELELIQIRLEKATKEIRQTLFIAETRSSEEEINDIIKRFHRPPPIYKENNNDFN